MKFKNILKFILVISITIGINSCQQKIKKKKVSNETKTEIGFNFDNKTELAIFNKLNLDETHPNLLNPQI